MKILNIKYIPFEPVKPSPPLEYIKKYNPIDVGYYEKEFTIADIEKKLPPNIMLSDVIFVLESSYEDDSTTITTTSIFYLTKIKNPKYESELKKYNKEIEIYNKKYSKFQVELKEYEEQQAAKQLLLESQALQRAEKELLAAQRKVEKLKKKLKV